MTFQKYGSENEEGNKFCGNYGTSSNSEIDAKPNGNGVKENEDLETVNSTTNESIQNNSNVNATNKNIMISLNPRNPKNKAQTIQELAFSKYVEILLRDYGITTVEQLMKLTSNDLKNMKRIGKKSLQEIEAKISLLR